MTPLKKAVCLSGKDPEIFAIFELASEATEPSTLLAFIYLSAATKYTPPLPKSPVPQLAALAE